MSLRKKLPSQTSSWANWNMKQKKKQSKTNKEKNNKRSGSSDIEEENRVCQKIQLHSNKKRKKYQSWGSALVFFFLIYTMLRFFSHNKGISNAISVLNKIFKPSSPPFSFAFAVTGKCFSSRREKYFLFVLFIFPLPGLHIFSLQPSAVN